MERDLSNLVGICGLYCGTCPSYLAYRKNDTGYVKKRAKEKGYTIEGLRCDGCLSDKVADHCKDCRHGFRSCAAEKHVNWCFECEEFPCQRLKDFTGIHIINGISHHEHVIDDLQYMKQHGIEEWIKIKDKASRCTGCGEVLYWFDHKCPVCNGLVER